MSICLLCQTLKVVQVIEDSWSVADVLRVWQRMLLMRAVEEQLADAARTGEIHGEMHVALGQESVAAVLQEFLRDGDAVVSTHRPHLHAMAAGVPVVPMLAEILERDGLNRGKGGHMHLFSPEHNFMCTGIVGASAPLSLGYALSRTQLHRGEGLLSVCVLGDGSMNQGAVMESMNLAAVRQLPVLFLVENNGYGISVPLARATAGDLHRRGEAFGIPGFHVDGSDLLSLNATLRSATTQIRSGAGPVLVVADVYRFSGHYEGDLDLYRSAAEKEAARTSDRCPVERTATHLATLGVTPEVIEESRDVALQQAIAWMAAARSIPLPEAATAGTGELVGV